MRGPTPSAGTALAFAALGLALINPVTLSAEQPPPFTVSSGNVDAKTPTLTVEPLFRRAAISEPRSPRPPREPAPGTLLIAHHKLQDPNFLKSVVLLAEYSAEGALGLILNRPTAVALADALAEVEKLRGRPDRLYAGGPVERNRIFLLIESEQPPANAFPVIRDLYLSASAVALEQLLDSSNSEQLFRAYAGYAGWGPGQLDGELDRGDWQLWWGDRDVVFSDEDIGLWRRLISESTQRWVRRRANSPGRFLVSGPARELDAVLAKLFGVHVSGDLKISDWASTRRGLR